MYGTIGRLTIKAGQFATLAAIVRELEGLPGVHAMSLVGKNDSPVEYYWTIVWQDEATHDAINARPEAGERYARLIATLDGDPTWHSGEIAYQLDLYSARRHGWQQ
jgi:quinol monooxygenase YgiN